MSRKLTKPYQLEIPANGFVNVPTWGDYFRVKNITTGATVTIENHDGDRVEQIGIAQDYKFDDMFQQLQVINDTGSAISVTAIIGFGRFGDNEVAGTVTLETPTGLTSTADVNATNASALLLAANTDRRAVVLCNIGGIDTRIGDSNVGASRGHLLKADGVLTLETEAAIYGYAASDNAISILEIE